MGTRAEDGHVLTTNERKASHVEEHDIGLLSLLDVSVSPTDVVFA